MANTVTSNTNLTWLQDRWGGPISNTAQFDIYTFNHTTKTLSLEIDGNDFTGGLSVETISKSLGQQIIVVWREGDEPTTYSGSSTYVVEGWA